jgi:hypothetical protein
MGGAGRANPLAREPPGTDPYNLTYNSHQRDIKQKIILALKTGILLLPAQFTDF